MADVRLAEVMGALSLACDVADGFPVEKVMRTVVLAVELGRHHGLDEATLRDVYWTALFRYLGCTGFAHEEAHHYGAGDDIATRNVMSMADMGDKVETLARVVRGIGKGGGAARRVKAVARILGDGVAVTRHAQTQCEISLRMATLVGVSDGVRAALAQICERYDGKGAPRGTAGDALVVPIRVAHVADVAEIEHHRHGAEAAIALVKKRAGRQLDPRVAKTFLAAARPLLEGIGAGTVWERFLAAEPAPRAMCAVDRLDDVALAFAQFADLKSSWTLGHSTGVARLVAAASSGLAEDEARLLRRAAWLHDLGRVSAPNAVWDKPSALSPSEWERVRLHAYWTERILWQAPALRDVARLACGAHERLDGGGYHRSLPAAAQSRAARLLAAADAVHAMGEPRPHRPPLDAGQIARAVREEIDAGRIERQAAEAVLDAAGISRERRRASFPAGLSEREVEVLRLVARGRTNKEIAVSLGISPRTAQHHTIHIYRKIGVETRAAAALFAVEHDLLG